MKTEQIEKNNPVGRGKMLLDAFGWQGGTIHQLAEETGLSVEDLLYTPLRSMANAPLNCELSHGWFAGRTCTPEHNKVNVFPKYKGNVDFWHGLIRGLLAQRDGI